MDTVDWITQSSPDACPRIVNKILETLKKHLPFSGPEGLNELTRIVARFEDKIFNKTEYLRQISMKMLSVETKSQNVAGSFSAVYAANNNNQPLVLGHHMDNDNLKPSLWNKEPAVSTGPSGFTPEENQRVVDHFRKISLKMHVCN